MLASYILNKFSYYGRFSKKKPIENLLDKPPKTNHKLDLGMIDHKVKFDPWALSHHRSQLKDDILEPLATNFYMMWTMKEYVKKPEPIKFWMRQDVS